MLDILHRRIEDISSWITKIGLFEWFKERVKEWFSILSLNSVGKKKDLTMNNTHKSHVIGSSSAPFSSSLGFGLSAINTYHTYRFARHQYRVSHSCQNSVRTFFVMKICEQPTDGSAVLKLHPSSTLATNNGPLEPDRWRILHRKKKKAWW
jgi:hypothetical protein